MKNKALIITNIIILVCIIIGLLIFMIFGMNGRFHFWNTKSSLIQTKIYSLDDIVKLSSDLKSYDISIEEDSENEIKVEVYGSKKSAQDIHVELIDGELQINQVGSTFCFGFCWSNSKVIVYVPQNLDISTHLRSTSGDIMVKSMLNREDNVVKTTSGDIDIRYAKEINAKSTSGEIKIGEVKSGTLKSTSGDIFVHKVNEIDAKTTSGDIEIQELNRYCNLNSTSGDIEVNAFIIDSNSNIESTSGDVEVYLKNEANIYVNTISGDQHIKKSHGEVELNIKTTSGDVTVK